jgi:hypothetical protein
MEVQVEIQPPAEEEINNDANNPQNEEESKAGQFVNERLLALDRYFQQFEQDQAADRAPTRYWFI